MRKAFTLVELIIVLCVIGVIVAMLVGVVRNGGFSKKVHRKEYRQ